MADDEKNEETEAETGAPQEHTGPVVPTMLGHDPTGVRSLLSRPSDVAARPGFRAPSNSRSKAQAAKKKAKGRKKR